MSNYQISWSDEAQKADTHVHVLVSSNEGTELLNSEMTFGHFFETMMDAEVYEARDQTVIGMRKETKKIVGFRRERNSQLRVETPIMNNNWIKHIYKKDKDEHLVVCELSKKNWDMYYHQTFLEAVGHPRMIFAYRISNGGYIDKINIFSIKGTRQIKGDTMLYKYPYANVTIGGSVCMGNNNLPNIKNLSQCSTLHNMFFGSPSSDCYFGDGRNDSGITELRELYTKMQHSEFPEDWLISEGMTFEKFLKRF
ncbi:hypothetical protein [Paenibacillus sp. VTT E-133291]|uniref:hypothetical protein n=1 Tax=Paenibacillus sp. VTT E-133291 TaxID=1986223 RepID=UPI000B9FC9B2|nr:hypothetical protein [Paenibacillus sp. VTT E-133291]OZQ97422.1 hypothetical protein CA598_06400 [Paenibacillus sp. VTT E-133291]